MTYPQSPHDPAHTNWQVSGPTGAPQLPQQAYLPSPVPYGYGPPMQAIPARPSSSLSVWALVLGLVGFFAGWCMLGLPCVAAVIIGHLAVADTKNEQKSGRGMAVTGLALGYVMIAPAVFLFFWLILGAGASLIPGVGVTPTPTAWP